MDLIFRYLILDVSSIRETAHLVVGPLQMLVLFLLLIFSAFKIVSQGDLCMETFGQDVFLLSRISKPVHHKLTTKFII